MSAPGNSTTEKHIMYQVFQDGKPCSSYKIKGWNIDTFSTKREAEIFALLWAYPYTREIAEANHKPMKLNVPVDYGMTEVSVMMEIREA